jgi:hypothetical protein
MSDDALAIFRKLAELAEPEQAAPTKPQLVNSPGFYRRREAHRTFMRFAYRVPGRQSCRR